MSGHLLRDDQVYVVHGVRNYCIDSRGNKLNEDIVVTIVHEYFGYEILPGRSFGMITEMGNPNYWMTKMVAERMMDPKHKMFFESKAHELYARYSKGLELHTPAPDNASVTGK